MLKCYNEGLIDPEFLTNTQPAWTQKMTQKDKAFVTFDWIDRMTMFKEQTLDSIPEYEEKLLSIYDNKATYIECYRQYATVNVISH